MATLEDVINAQRFNPEQGARRIDRVSSTVVYIGLGAHGSLTSAAAWRICRVSIQGTQTVTEYANGGAFDQVWDNRASLFGTIPFSNAYSATFDGVNDYLELGDVFNYERTVPWSRSFWFRPTSMAATHTMFARKNVGVGTMVQVQGNGRVYVELRNTNSTNHLAVQGPTGNVLINTWYNLVVTYDGSSTPAGIQAYLNGSVVTLSTVLNTLTSSILSPGVTAQIGAVSGASFVTGYLDEVSFWSRVLTSTEVTEIFNSGTPANLSSHSAYSVLTNWWRMGDVDAYPVVSDVRGTVNATMTNMSSSSFVEFTP